MPLEIESGATCPGGAVDRPDIAAAQDGLGTALIREGERASGDKALALLDQAVQAYENALRYAPELIYPRNGR
jgi:hypothetical protein